MAVLGECCAFTGMLRVYGCVFCFNSLLFVYMCVRMPSSPNKQTNKQSKVHSGSALGPGASRLPYYCTPPVCIPAVIGRLVVWRHNNKKNHRVLIPHHPDKQ